MDNRVQQKDESNFEYVGVWLVFSNGTCSSEKPKQDRDNTIRGKHENNLEYLGGLVGIK